jgi:hypothetical protein
MVFQADLYTYLHANAGLTALIGARLYPNDAPPDVPVPFVVYYEFATPREQLMSCAIGVSKPRIQYSTYADTYADALAVTDALRAAFAASTYLVTYEDERGNQDVTTGLHRRDLDVRIVHA